MFMMQINRWLPHFHQSQINTSKNIPQASKYSYIMAPFSCLTYIMKMKAGPKIRNNLFAKQLLGNFVNDLRLCFYLVTVTVTQVNVSVTDFSKSLLM